MRQKNTLTHLPVLVIGLGASGQSAARFLLQQDSLVVGVDQNQQLLQSNKELSELCQWGMKVQHESQPIDLESFKLVVVSPGVPQSHRLYQAAQKKGIEVIGEAELACRYLDNIVIGITGTNGKTTVTKLVAHVLNHSGKRAVALGNVGTALSSALLEATFSTIIVAELSSFQLETLYSRALDAAVILNITPDHLDRYVTMQEYASAKIQIQNCLKPNACLFVQEDVLNHFQQFFDYQYLQTYGYSSSCSLASDLSAVQWKGELKFTLPASMLGRRSIDLENMMAAYALCREMGVETEQFCRAFASFTKPPHRIQFVRQLNQVSYYDDSKATNIDAVIKAVTSLPGEIILIAGGVDKGAPYTPWIAPFKGKVRHIFAIGSSAEKIKKELGEKYSVHLAETLEEAVQKATLQARAHESILLSPGCSSYDMFKSYVHRGEEYQRIVKAL